MSELMTPIPFRELMTWITTEYRRDGAVFGVHKPYKAGVKKLPIFGEAIETPFGPAAGPNTQLAQNIIAGYFAGARFFELKTVQKMDGADLAACINRPCILAEDECYNCEWSTELYVQQAFEEYVKAWCALKIMAKVYGLGDPNGFVFNMSVGYDLAGIQGEKIDTFLNGMVDASKTPIFQECIAVLKEFFPGESDYIDTITPHVSGSVTVSTLHGCPPDEIERIASYLLEKKHLHTFVKCNPTILGYETARSILDSMGYDYIAFDDHHFKEDLQYADAVPMFHRLQALADKEGLEFGLKLSNTFPVDVKAGELPSEEMYMAGKSLFPLTTTMAAMMAKEFGGKLRLSYAGGADAFNIDKLFACGIWPITMATTELKPGGYQRFTQIGDKLDALDFKPFTGVDVVGIEALSLAARSDKYHVKAIKPLPRRKLYEKVPLLDCFTAPCKGGCPIHQDIPEYIELCRKGAYASALRLITEKNPLPFITGTICAHNCMTKCMRNYYDEPVNIRATKLVAAEKGYDAYMSKITPPAPVTDGRKVAVIGGGPTGMSAAYFVGRAGIPVTLFEKADRLGGIVRQVIPAFRISDEAIDKDVALMEKMGVEVKLNTEAPSVAELKAQGYTHIFFAVGAWKAGRLDIPGNVVPVIGWLRDMKAGKDVSLGHVAVVGGGNTAMDAARAALRAGAKSSTLVYRRTKKYMPADAEELEMAIADGVEFLELVAPVEQKDGKLICEKMKLGDPDDKGRRQPVPTGEMVEIPCDTVVSAVGEKVESEVFTRNGITVDEKGIPAFKTNLEGVYAGGDAMRGPATVVEGIADAQYFANAVIGEAHKFAIPAKAVATREEAVAKKGVLCESAKCEGDRCLTCNVVCQVCADVCPNRANVVIELPDGRQQILHVDRMCNECGNCAVFCPYDSAPYREKFTLFLTREGFDESVNNQGFLPLGGKKVLVRLDSKVFEADLDAKNDLPADIEVFIWTVLTKYAYLMG
ncbi:MULTISPECIES: putative selenate reductase subunit YgfK [Oscillospiraceae]|uniref:putative selenate reductase subunit YgfK n=1 Tax=Oscillospiraceae TaxID=216572 RepID=UPI0003AE4109|nr:MULTISPECIES: putative selenate reductase subunit YgfK [unclassified Oscillibacter]ERK63374.1 putative selenate reductase, YgfK subunit [Oscillibacter sp. KLE 1728]ERK65346.1 putative selenate reductase, YgfK subunit [Oscillibacter sp. KLE 1745]